MTASAVAVHPAQRFRTGYLSSLLAAGSPDEDGPAFTCQLVIEAFAALAASPARIGVVTKPPNTAPPDDTRRASSTAVKYQSALGTWL